MPIVSVLMSNYKTDPSQLKTAIDSVLCQTLSDIEIVIINDGIEDASYELLKKYAEKDSRIVLVPNEENMGLAWSLNRGVKLCRGRYIARMDTDDICYSERLEKQVKYMDEHPDMILSGAWAHIFEDDENVITDEFSAKMYPHDEYLIRLLFANDPIIVHPTAIFNNDLLKKFNLNYDYSPEYKYSEDYRMWTLCSKYGEIGILEDYVIKYRNSQSDSRITIRHSDKMTECSKNVQRELLKDLDIFPTKEQSEINLKLLFDRKPYDIKYKKWIYLLIKQNQKNKIYNFKLFSDILEKRWYNIVYYGVAYERSIFKRLSMLLNLKPKYQIKLLKEAIFKNS